MTIFRSRSRAHVRTRSPTGTSINTILSSRKGDQKVDPRYLNQVPEPPNPMPHIEHCDFATGAAAEYYCHVPSSSPRRTTTYSSPHVRHDHGHNYLHSHWNFTTPQPVYENPQYQPENQTTDVRPQEYTFGRQPSFTWPHPPHNPAHPPVPQHTHTGHSHTLPYPSNTQTAAYWPSAYEYGGRTASPISYQTPHPSSPPPHIPHYMPAPSSAGIIPRYSAPAPPATDYNNCNATESYNPMSQSAYQALSHYSVSPTYSPSPHEDPSPYQSDSSPITLSPSPPFSSSSSPSPASSPFHLSSPNSPNPPRSHSHSNPHPPSPQYESHPPPPEEPRSSTTSYDAYSDFQPLLQRRWGTVPVEGYAAWV